LIIIHHHITNVNQEEPKGVRICFFWGQKVLRFKFSALFCQLSLNMLGRQQLLILLVEKDQQVLQMGKTITITNRNICIHMQ
jgi:hypothetical protein